MIAGCGSPASTPGAGADDSATDAETGRDGFVLGEVQACDTPLPEVAWTEHGGAWGLTGSPVPERHADGGGIALADFDGDGLIDLFYHFQTSHPEVWLQQTDGTFALGYSFEYPSLGGQATALDVDGDGRAEVLYGGPVVGVFQNLGGLVFEGELVPIEPDLGSSGRLIVPLDLENNGRIDLFVPTTAPEEVRDDDLLALQDHLLRQGPGGSLTVESLGEAGRRDGFDGVPLDWGDDGDTDLYVVNDKGTVTGPNVLWENEGGTLRDVSDSCDCDLAISGMGGSAADVDGDGIVDLFVTATGRNHLLQGLDDGTFVDVSFATRASTLVDAMDMCWGSALADLDNDGLTDIVMARGDLWYTDDDKAERAYESAVDLLFQGSDGRFSEEGGAYGLPREGSWRGVIAWDLNADGVLDLVLHDVEDRPQVWLSEGCTEAGWLAVDAPTGSRVQVRTAMGTQVRWPSHAVGYGSTAPPRAWFGLGEDEEIEELEVRLPDGSTRTLTGPLPARRVISLDGEG